MTSDKVVIDLVLKETLPTISKKDNEKITHKISSFSTNVADSTGARKSNVRIAMNKLDGLRINPGETVSFNYITGPHTLDNGYKVATIIYNGKFVDGVGGGVCQASTTLYNALLRAGVQIDEVNKHTLPVKYVPLALDAMVSEFVSDLRFTNTFDTAIFISAYCDADRAYVDIYGAPMEEGVEYRTRSETVRVIPHGGDNIMLDKNKEYTDKVLFKGEYYRLSIPKDGYEVKAYLGKYKDGELIEESLIRHEIYQPQNGLVVEGVETPPENLKPIESDVVINR
jgi:vancomycin resistance protein YoaR